MDNNKSTREQQPAEQTDEIVLTLTLSGNREKLSALLAEMARMDGYSVIKGSFSPLRGELYQQPDWLM